MSDPKATAPLLSDDELTAITKRYPEVNGDTSTAYETGDEIRAWYESKITSGELRVVKTVTALEWADNKCCDYASKYMDYRDASKFCPNCGAKIIEG